MPESSRYIAIGDALQSWLGAIQSGERPIRWPVGPAAWDSVAIGPGRIVLLGGAPNTGKSGLTLQWSVDAVLLNPGVRAIVANVEMPVAVLLDRIVARLAGIDVTRLHERTLDKRELERARRAVEKLVAVGDRLAFLMAPFTLENMATAADAVQANLLVLDYLQRFEPPGDHRSRRESINAVMSDLRRFADGGAAILAVAAVGRVRDKTGRNGYDAAGLNLASFRESSELEFGADDAYLLIPDKSDENVVNLRHVKSRYGRRQDLRLRFDGPRMRFDVVPDGGEPRPRAEKREPDPDDLAALWRNTPTAR
ncbi:MAG: AAA family ATPase [Thermogutta sp.]|nr:AAA family ATPase [Thermogutta sp.]